MMLLKPRCLLSITAFFALALSSQVHADWYQSTAQPSLTVRNDAQVTADKIGSVPPDGKVNIIERTHKKDFISGRSGEWVKIEWNDSYGYVFDSFLVPLEKSKNTTASKASSTPQSNTILKFKDYPVKAIYSGKTAKLNMGSELARTFRTRLSEALSEKPEFAGEYVSTTWGCGTSCATTVFVSKRTGKVLSNEFGSGSGQFIVGYKVDSRLLVAQGEILDKAQMGTGQYAAFFYLLDKEQLKLVKTVEIAKPDDIDGDGLPD